MPTLQSITDDLIIKTIDSAKERLVFIAPAVWPSLAESVAQAWNRLGADRVTAILDVDPEVCRFGFGSLDGFQILQTAATLHGQTLGNEPGIRICVVIADDRTLIFSPTPKLIEAPPGENTEVTTTRPKTNGIVLDKPPATLSDEVGAGSEKDARRTVGIDPVQPKKLESVAQDLEVNPPKPFDLTQAVQVYNGLIQFVELRVVGCRLSEHRAKLPKDLIHIVKQNKELARKITNSIKLLDGEDELVTDEELSETTIGAVRTKIEEDLLTHVPGGTV